MINVAPYKGAWIEIEYPCNYRYDTSVAPYKGAWIEIQVELKDREARHSRSLQGSVD